MPSLTILVPPTHPFDSVGDLHSHSIQVVPVPVDGEESSLITTIDQAVDFHSPHFPVSDEDDCQLIQVQLHEQHKNPPDYEQLRPFFLQATTDVVK